jgi:hypothetical protein
MWLQKFRFMTLEDVESDNPVKEDGWVAEQHS